MRSRIMTDRVACLQERYQGGNCNESVFEELWGQHPQRVKVRAGPYCLQRFITVPEEDPLEESFENTTSDH